MLKLLTELFGSNYVKSLIGTKSNITKPIRMDFNSPYKVYSDDAFENPKALAIIEEKIKEGWYPCIIVLCELLFPMN